ncbi:MAG: FecR domain-containing protein, partial [Acidobacteria bacterium]|nr:FecR domain-containing protein [Acidobacteriota bacterium]
MMPAPAHISVIDGAALLVRDGQAEAATSNIPLLEGDRLRADAGRLEVLLPDGSALYLDQRTTVDLLSAALMRLTDGRMILVVSGRPDERPVLDYQIDAPAGSIHIVRPGEYRVSIVQGTRGPDVELAVVRGEATLDNEQDSVAVRAGEHAFASEGLAPSNPQPFNSARVDAFVRWSDDCRNALVGYASRQYLPPEIQVYAGAFDRYGSWDTYQPYGDVWYPTVQADWRPYYDGFWRPLGYYGWTWIGNDPWSWPTHHYGRWGFGTRGWFWIPGRSWASAWVSWGLGSSYVSWCPLGWDNRPVFSLGVGINTFGGRGYDPWYGWTAIPRHSFGEATRVAGVAVPRHLLGSLRGRFT